MGHFKNFSRGRVRDAISILRSAAIAVAVMSTLPASVFAAPGDAIYCVTTNSGSSADACKGCRAAPDSFDSDDYGCSQNYANSGELKTLCICSKGPSNLTRSASPPIRSNADRDAYKKKVVAEREAEEKVAKEKKGHAFRLHQVVNEDEGYSGPTPAGKPAASATQQAQPNSSASADYAPTAKPGPGATANAATTPQAGAGGKIIDDQLRKERAELDDASGLAAARKERAQAAKARAEATRAMDRSDAPDSGTKLSARQVQERQNQKAALDASVRTDEKAQAKVDAIVKQTTKARMDDEVQKAGVQLDAKEKLTSARKAKDDAQKAYETAPKGSEADAKARYRTSLDDLAQAKLDSAKADADFYARRKGEADAPADSKVVASRKLASETIAHQEKIISDRKTGNGSSANADGGSGEIKSVSGGQIQTPSYDVPAPPNADSQSTTASKAGTSKPGPSKGSSAPLVTSPAVMDKANTAKALADAEAKVKQKSKTVDSAIPTKVGGKVDQNKLREAQADLATAESSRVVAQLADTRAAAIVARADKSNPDVAKRADRAVAAAQAAKDADTALVKANAEVAALPPTKPPGKGKPPQPESVDTLEKKRNVAKADAEKSRAEAKLARAQSDPAHPAKDKIRDANDIASKKENNLFAAQSDVANAADRDAKAAKKAASDKADAAQKSMSNKKASPDEKEVQIRNADRAKATADRAQAKALDAKATLKEIRAESVKDAEFRLPDDASDSDKQAAAATQRKAETEAKQSRELATHANTAADARQTAADARDRAYAADKKVEALPADAKTDELKAARKAALDAHLDFAKKEVNALTAEKTVADGVVVASKDQVEAAEKHLAEARADAGKNKNDPKVKEAKKTLDAAKTDAKLAETELKTTNTKLAEAKTVETKLAETRDASGSPEDPYADPRSPIDPYADTNAAGTHPAANGTQTTADEKPAGTSPAPEVLRIMDEKAAEGHLAEAARADEEKKAGYIRSQDATNQAGDPEKCGTSAQIGDYGCGGTRNTIQGAQISNMVTQTMGSVATTFAGQSAQQQAMEQGTQAAALRGAASTQKTAAKAQGFAAGLNAIMGALQIGQSQMHKGYVSKINAATDGKNVQANGYQNGKLDDPSVAKNMGDGTKETESGFIRSDTNQDTQRAIDNFGLQDGKIQTSINVDKTFCKRYQDAGLMSAYDSCLNRADHEIAARTSQIEGKLSDTKKMLRQIGNNARVEQQAVASEAMSGGMNSLVTGITQGMNAAFNYKAAQQMEEAARTLEKLQNMTPPAPVFTPLGPSNMGPQDALAPGGGQSLNPGTGTASAATDETQEAPPAFGNLGDPSGNAQPTDPLPGPPGGEFNAGNAPGGGGSGGGLGGVGGASTSPSTGGDSEPQAKMVEQGRTPNYESAGGTFGAGGGGGGAASNGPDLSGLLAQFLPQKEEQDAKGNGILDFGARGLASEAPISLLDRNANIFERIHETYQDKNRRGRVGL